VRAAEIVPPLLYSAIWPILGVLALLLVVAWFVLVPLLSRLLSRRRPKKADERPRPAARGFAGTLAGIDEVERAALANEISIREAHLRLSELVRSFASEGRVYDARTMTLTELRDHGMTVVAEAVAQFYPIAFQEDELTELGPAPDIAREAVRAWN
jgi:hypothetical protein